MKTNLTPLGKRVAWSLVSTMTQKIGHQACRPARAAKWLVTLALALCAGVAQAQLLTLDNGKVGTVGGESGGDLLALNHFNTGSTPDLVTSIGVLWNPISAAVAPTVAIYSDPNGNGNPSDMVPLLIQPINITPGVVVLNNTSVQWYSITPTVVSGSFFVGAFLSDKNHSSPGIGVCYANLGPGQSWVVENTAAGHLNLQNPISTASDWENLDAFTQGNHMIEATISPVPEPATIVLLISGGLGCLIGRRRERR